MLTALSAMMFLGVGSDGVRAGYSGEYAAAKGRPANPKKKAKRKMQQASRRANRGVNRG
jgi:hypothetical protein